MQTGLLLQYVVVAAVVAYSAWFVARRQFPDGTRRMRIALAVPLVREGRPGWMRALGQRLAPAAMPRDGACGGCNGCS
ncbi:hypothetical protein FZO89_01040 [Luteimonas viscosa]|uniref:Uncharacterized protein n=1 Tax=Luteimonas viscosa TaxID=1132694 RepID=A0A5D4XJW9_9GAMM|nr:DUF6587 family protein [Luteimonas viscosa]TYT24977.1 hypothetical protein FZO89_01040 [Luteimonas viscosa]